MRPDGRRRPLVFVVVACSSAGAAPSVAGSDPNAPVTTDPAASFDPGRPDPGGARLVVPRPGQLDVHARPAESFAATVDGHHLVVTIAWTSGVEPCTVLDSIVVQRGTGTVTLTLREGRGPGNGVCIEIAEMKRTMVDLGDVARGTYRIVDGAGGAPAIEVTIG